MDGKLHSRSSLSSSLARPTDLTKMMTWQRWKRRGTNVRRSHSSCEKFLIWISNLPGWILGNREGHWACGSWQPLRDERSAVEDRAEWAWSRRQRRFREAVGKKIKGRRSRDGKEAHQQPFRKRIGGSRKGKAKEYSRWTWTSYRLVWSLFRE